MKKIFNLYNITLVLILALVSVLTLKTTEVKATGALTWPNGSTATISRTVQNVYNAPVVDFTYTVSKPSATFDIGVNVNVKMKNLANNSSSMSFEDEDETIMAIKKANSLPNGFTPTTANTVSTSGSKYPIYIYWDSTTSTIYYYSEADIIYLNPNSSGMFYTLFALIDISGLSGVDASKVTDMSEMFYECYDLASIGSLVNWDTSNVEYMIGMFEACESLNGINSVTSWDTSSVKHIDAMFRYCSKASGTIQILGNPTSYGGMFFSAATASGAQITVNYGSGTSNIDNIIATKSNNSNVVKGSQVSPPSPSPSGGTVATATISFNGNETVSNTYTVSKSTTVNLANMGLSFTEPGNYEYTVSEIATSNNAYPTTNTEYTIVICVRNELNANNRPTGNYTATYYIKDANDNKVNSMSFAHVKDESYFGHLEISKRVKGMMGSPNKYFDFTVQVDNATGGTCSSYTGSEKYPVTGVDTGHFSAAEVTKCKSGTKDSISIKHGQVAKIGQFTYNNVNYNSISIDDYYKIVEASESDYVTTFKIGSGSATSGRDTGSQSVSAGTNSITYYNEREGSPLTGIFINILPYLLLIGIGTGGFVLFQKKNKKKNEEDLEVI